MNSSKLIVIRGPSGSGKTTIAKTLQRISKRNVLIIEQDYYRHTLLIDKPDEKNIVPELIYQNAMTMLNAGYDVIVEGIFRQEKYKQMFQHLIDRHHGESYIFYFNVGFDETIRRHDTRDKAALFTAEDMKKWYYMAEPLGLDQERQIPEEFTETQAVSFIAQQVGFLNVE